jgi:hypothetical protein
VSLLSSDERSIILFYDTVVLHTLVFTDIAAAWVECLPLRYRSQHAVIQALDPVRLLRQIEALQDALWKHAVLPTTERPEKHPETGTPPALRFTASRPLGRECPNDYG